MTIYSQRDARWANQRLGTVDGDTIGQYGCYLTSMAMMASYYGKAITPAQLDDKFSYPTVLYTDGDLMNDNQLTKIYPDVVYQKTYDYTTTPADIAFLKTLVNDPATCVILGVDFNHDLLDGIQFHFVLCDHFDADGHLWIDDPWTGTQVRFIDVYGDAAVTIQKYVVYKGSVSSVPVLSDTQKLLKIKSIINSSISDTEFRHQSRTILEV